MEAVAKKKTSAKKKSREKLEKSLTESCEKPKDAKASGELCSAPSVDSVTSFVKLETPTQASSNATSYSGLTTEIDNMEQYEKSVFQLSNLSLADMNWNDNSRLKTIVSAPVLQTVSYEDACCQSTESTIFEDSGGLFMGAVQPQTCELQEEEVCPSEEGQLSSVNEIAVTESQEPVSLSVSVVDSRWARTYREAAEQLLNLKQNNMEKIRLEPFTSNQLAAFYVNELIFNKEQILERFIESTNSLDSHPLYESVASYLRARSALEASFAELQKMKRQIQNSAEQVWIHEDRTVIREDKCLDGRSVRAHVKYSVAVYDENAVATLSRNLKLQRQLAEEQLILHSYSALLCKYRIDGMICSYQRPEFYSAISVLFAFLRRQIRDHTFLEDVKEWLSYLCGSLLKSASKEDYIFLAHHVLRCPAGLRKNLWLYIQCPTIDSFSPSVSSSLLEVAMAILNIAVEPIPNRESFLHTWDADGEKDANWVMLDSDGESDDCVDPLHLTDSDLVAILKQFPIADLIRSLLLISQRDGKDFYDALTFPEAWQASYWLRVFSVFSQLFGMLQTGLKTYSAPQYKNFAKKIGQMVSHLVCTLHDHWEKCSVYLRDATDSAMFGRLKAQYESVFTQAAAILISGRKQRLWQYTSNLPFTLLSTETRFQIWALLHWQIFNESNEDFSAQSLILPSFWPSFVSKMSTLPEPDLFLYVTTTGALVSDVKDIEETEYFQGLLNLIVWELVDLGLVEESTSVFCFKTCRETLAGLAELYPETLSFLVERLNDTLYFVGRSSVSFIKNLPFHLWPVTDVDLNILRGWLMNFSLNSVHHQLAVVVLDEMDYDRPGSFPLNRRVALLLLDAVCHFGTVTVWPSLVNDSVQYVTSLLRSQNWTSVTFTEWAWQLAARLRLHVLDCEDTKHVLENTGETFRSVPLLDSDPSLQKLRDAVTLKNPFAAFLALCVTDVGHSVPEICSRGFDILSLLSNAHRYREIVFVIEQIFPLFVDCPESLYSQAKFLSVFQSLLNADSTYYKLAKNIFVSDFPGRFLRLVSSLLEKTLSSALKYNQANCISILQLWLNILVRLPKWNVEKNSLFLIDILCREAFLTPRGIDTIKTILGAELTNAWAHRPSKGLASKVGSWVSGTVEIDSQPAPSGTLSADSKFQWLSWVVLDMESDYQQVLWSSLKQEIESGKKMKALESSLKSLTTKLKLSSISLNGMCIFRYAQLAVDLQIENPLLPLVLQRFFSFYLAQSATSGAVGDALIPAGSPVLKRVLNRCQEAASFYHERDISKKSKFQREMNKRLVELFEAFVQWLQDKRVVEPNCYLPTLPPNYLGPKLLHVFEGDTALWTEYFDPVAIRESQKEAALHLTIERRSGSKSRVRDINGGPEVCQGPVERLLSRLSRLDSTSNFIFRQIFPPVRKLSAELHSPQLMQEALEPHLQLLVRTAEVTNQRLAQQTALDCSFVELLADEFENVKKEAVLSAKCGSTENKDQCSGAALIQISYVQSRRNEIASRQVKLNREEAENLLNIIIQTPPAGVCAAALLIEDSVQRLITRGQPSVDVGAVLFYLLVQVCNEETNTYLPTKQLLSSCIEMLGRTFIAGQIRQCCHLVAILGNNPALSQMLAPHFEPCPAVASPENVDAFLEAYSLVTRLPKTENDLIFVLMTKFDLQLWLKNFSSSEDRSRLLRLIDAALSSYGQQPAANTLMVHELLRRHLQLLLLFNFPEHYPEVLELVLKACDVQNYSVHIWYDVSNALGQGFLKLDPTLSVADCNKQILNYTMHSSIFQLPQLTETVRLLTSHFSRERQTHGLYGLYPKYRPYVHAISCFYTMLGHLLCYTTLENDVGTPSNELVEKIWLQIRDLYSPWLLPYSQQQISSNCASWIQQLSSDRNLLLPWIATDSAFASTMLSSFAQCIQFLNETVPAQHSVLAHLMNFYLQGYCHRGVKAHIFNVLHSELCGLPWNQYTPSSSDMESLSQIAAQFLPEAHSFLAEIFVRVRWNSIVEVWDTAYPRPLRAKLMAFLLHLFVRLSAEPTAKQSSQMQRVLEEACSYSWSTIDSVAYEQSLHSFISTCEPHFVFVPFVSKQFKDFPTTCTSDAVLFRLLQAAGSSCIPSGSSQVLHHQDELNKRRLFVKAWLKLISTAASRYRNSLTRQPSVTRDALKTVVQHIGAISKAYHPMASECSHILLEVLSIIGSGNPLNTEMAAVLCDWLKSSNCEAYCVQAILQRIFSISSNLDSVAMVTETALEQHFSTKNSASLWTDVISYVQLAVSQSHMKQLGEKCAENGHILTLYALLVSSKDDDDKDKAADQLETIGNWFKVFRLTEDMEPKLVLLYKWILTLMEKVTRGMDTKTSTIENVKSGLVNIISAWTEESKGWFSSMSFSRSQTLSPKGRILARMFVGALKDQESVQVQQELLKLKSSKIYADCQNGLQVILNGLAQEGSVTSVAAELISRAAHFLYPNRFLLSAM